MILEVEYKDFKDNHWSLRLPTDDEVEITFNHNENKVRVYPISDIVKVEADNEYVFLYEYGTKDFYQVKFEDEGKLIIDKFDSEGEHIEEVGMFDFLEDI